MKDVSEQNVKLQAELIEEHNKFLRDPTEFARNIKELITAKTEDLEKIKNGCEFEIKVKANSYTDECD